MPESRLSSTALIISVLLMIAYLLLAPYIISATVGSGWGAWIRPLLIPATALVLVALLVFIVKLLWRVRPEANRRMQAISFQIARASVVLLLVGILVALSVPRGPETPLLGGPLPLTLLGVGFWGFLIGTIGYYWVGGEQKLPMYLLRFLTRVNP